MGDTTRVIWKYQIGPRNQQLSMPRGAKLLHVHTQGGVAFLWAEVDPYLPPETRTIDVRATGQPCAAEGEYIGTFHLSDFLVFHAYEMTDELEAAANALTGED